MKHLIPRLLPVALAAGWAFAAHTLKITPDQGEFAWISFGVVAVSVYLSARHAPADEQSVQAHTHAQV
jgi:hypothetical protein